MWVRVFLSRVFYLWMEESTLRLHLHVVVVDFVTKRELLLVLRRPLGEIPIRGPTKGDQMFAADVTVTRKFEFNVGFKIDMMAKVTFCIPSRRALPCSWDLSWMHPRLLHLRTMDLSLFCRSPLRPLHLHRPRRPRPAPQSPPALSGADTPTSRALPYSVPSRTPHTPPSPPRASALAPPACANQTTSCRIPE